MVVVAAVLLAAPAWAGLTFTQTTKQEGGPAVRGKGQEPNMDMTSKAFFEKDQGRIEIVQGAENPMMPKGGYMLIKEGGATMYMVNPAEKSYMKMDMAGMAGGAMGMMKMKVSDAKVEKILDEAGPTILKCPTRHLKFKTSYTMAMSMMGMNTSSAVIQEEEMWVTDKYKDAVLTAWKDRQAMKTGNKELDDLMKAQMGKVQGLPLKMVMVHTQKDSSGKTDVSKTTMEITAISEENISKDKFEIPAGYTEIDVGAMMQGGMEALKGMKMPPGVKMPPGMKMNKDEDAEE